MCEDFGAEIGGQIAVTTCITRLPIRREISEDRLRVARTLASSQPRREVRDLTVTERTTFDFAVATRAGAHDRPLPLALA